MNFSGEFLHVITNKDWWKLLKGSTKIRNGSYKFKFDSRFYNIQSFPAWSKVFIIYFSIFHYRYLG